MHVPRCPSTGGLGRVMHLACNGRWKRMQGWRGTPGSRAASQGGANGVQGGSRGAKVRAQGEGSWGRSPALQPGSSSGGAPGPARTPCPGLRCSPLPGIPPPAPRPADARPPSTFRAPHPHPPPAPLPGSPTHLDPLQLLEDVLPPPARRPLPPGAPGAAAATPGPAVPLRFRAGRHFHPLPPLPEQPASPPRPRRALIGRCSRLPAADWVEARSRGLFPPRLSINASSAPDWWRRGDPAFLQTTHPSGISLAALPRERCEPIGGDGCSSRRCPAPL